MMLLVLAIVGLMVLVVTVTPPKTPSQSGSQATPAPRLVPDDSGDFDVSATLSADGDAKPQTIEAALRDDVEIIVEGVGPASVSLGDLRTAVYEEGLPARITLMAETPGAYPLVPRRTAADRHLGSSLAGGAQAPLLEDLVRSARGTRRRRRARGSTAG